MVYAFGSYSDGNLQFSGNVQSAELDGECTGIDCQTEGEVTTLPPPPPPTGLSKHLVIHVPICTQFAFVAFIICRCLHSKW